MPLRALLWMLLGALLGALGALGTPDGSLGGSEVVLGSIWGRVLIEFGPVWGGFSLRFAGDCPELLLRFFVRCLASEHV